MATTKLGLRELVIQTLEGELAGVSLYTAALTVVVRKDLEKAWRGYLEETEHHVMAAHGLCDALGIPHNEEDAGRQHVRDTGRIALETVADAAKHETPERAQVLAAHCILEAELMHQLRWQTLALFADNAPGYVATTAVRNAARAVGEDEVKHLLQSRVWLRELLLDRMGLAVALPPRDDMAAMVPALRPTPGFPLKRWQTPR